ncbi:hypothetical protein [Lunatimonas salinarum]|uniref:hypothetical protein n=1 Tax=Lunatimonas salinarum TaxID=1774590 RepID=UPI001FD76ECE|nr:hypothetical protein [Lunatimonas salinarum]
MAKALLRSAYIFVFFLLGVGLQPFSLSEVLSQSIGRRFETEISFPKDLSTPEVKFNLQLTGSRKFKIVLDEVSNELTNVRVFDILGNLILEDKIMPKDGLQKNYDFSGTNSQLFVVEVGNAKYNKTKSIYAHPQGTRLEKVGN